MIGQSRSAQFRITSKGQITIPVDVRNHLKVDAGDRVEFVLIAPGRFEFMASNSEVSALKGMFGPAKKVVSIDSMNAAIAKRAGMTLLVSGHAASV